METLWQDLKQAARMLRKNPGFTAVAVLTLALGIGANTAIFSAVNGVLLRPLPYEHPERLVKIWETRPQSTFARTVNSEGEYLAWREQLKTLEQVAIVNNFSFNLAGAGDPERIPGGFASVSLFSMLGVKPALGRAFLAEEEKPGRDQVALLTDGLWERRFGRDPQVVGKKILLESKPFTVVGVLPKGFFFNQQADIWVPLVPAATEDDRYGHHYLEAFARLQPGVTLQQAEAEMNNLAKALEQQRPLTNSGHGIELQPLHEWVVGDVRAGMLALLGAVGMVLLIACGNVANLLLSRAAARRKEMAIRTALGATRLRIIRQVLTEGFLLSLLGGALAILVSLWSVDLLVRISKDIVPRAEEIKLDGTVLGFTVALSLLAGLAFSLVPALQGSDLSPGESLKESGGNLAHRSRRRMHLLVIGEIGLALLVLVGAGLLTRSFLRLSQVNPGFHPQGILTAELALEGDRYKEKIQRVEFYLRLLEKLQGLPGVRSAAAVDYLPLGGSNSSTTLTIEGLPPAAPGHRPNANNRSVTADYFRVMGIPLVRGREFTDRDTADSPGVVIINETLARRFFPGENPIGKRLHRGSPETKEPKWVEIVGIVGDIKHAGLRADARQEMYFPHPQYAEPDLVIVLRADGDPKRFAAAVRSEAQSLDKSLPVGNIQTMEEVFDSSLDGTRLPMLLFGGFALVALLLSAVGIYGVMAYSVEQRTREIGIRLSLGAQRRDVLRMVLLQGLRLAALGVVFGIVGALALARVMATLLYSVTATDPITFAGVALVLTTVALLACYIPARRAMRVDPMVALRYE